MNKLVYLWVIFTISLNASAIKCLDILDKRTEDIKKELNANGDFYIADCSIIAPYLHIVLVDLDDSHNKISITHGEKVSKGYPLKTITELANQEDAKIAVNGFTWVGDQGDNLNQYATNPAGTVYSKNKELNKRKNTKEVVLGFSKRTHEGTKVKLFDRSNGEMLEGVFLQDADNSTTSLIKHGTKTGAATSYQTSSVGIGSYSGKNILIILSSHKSESASLLDHYDIFDYFGATEAMRLDGNSATSLYYNEKHLNPLNKYSPLNVLAYYKFRKYGKARHIMYGLTVTKVPSLQPAVDKICPSDYFKYYNTGTLDELLKSGDKDVKHSGGSKHQVAELQSYLKSLDIDIGSTGADGWYGEDTVNAVITYQNSNGLTPSGAIDIETQENINNSCIDNNITTGGGTNPGETFDYQSQCSSVEFPDPIPTQLETSINEIITNAGSSIAAPVVCPLIDTVVKAYNLTNGGGIPSPF